MRFRSKTGFNKGFKKLLAPQILNGVTSGRLQSAVGQQAVDCLNTYVQSGGGIFKPFLGGFYDFADMQSILATTEPQASTQVGINNTTTTTRRMKLLHCEAKYTIKNHTTEPIEVHLYDVVARRDTQSAIQPNVTWSLGVGNEAVAIPGNVGLANNQTYNFPGSTPFQSEQFCQLFKVKKVTRFFLHPGSEHVHRIKIVPGGLFNNEYTRNFYALKGITTWLMAVVKGGLVQDKTAGSGLNQVSYGTAEIAYTCETQYRFTALERSRTAYAQYSAIPLAVGTETTVNEDTDAPITNTVI